MTSLRANLAKHRADLAKRWRAFRALPAGARFRRFHEQQKNAPGWVKPLLVVGAVVSLAVAVVLTIFPGPAFVFYGLAGALLATQSIHVARLLDRGELAARALVGRMRDTWDTLRRRIARHRSKPKKRSHPASRASGAPSHSRAA